MILSKRKTIFIILTIILVLGMVNISAEDSLAIEDIGKLQDELSQEQSPAASQSNNVALEFVKLLFVLVLIIGAAWSVVKLFGQKATARLQGTWLHVVDEVILGQSRGIILCEVGQKVYAVGVTDHNISLLFEINNPKLMEEIASGEYLQQHNKTGYNRKLFKNSISKLLTGNDSLSNKKDFHYLMEEQNQRLHEMFDLNNADKKTRRSDEDGAKYV